MSSRNMWWAVGAVGALAALDLLSAFLAKELSLRPRWQLLALGLLTMSALFVVYVRTLSLTELWIATFGWVVLMEIGVLLLDRFWFGTPVSPRKLLIAGVIVALQVLLMLPDASTADASLPRELPAAQRASGVEQPVEDLLQLPYGGLRPG